MKTILKMMFKFFIFIQIGIVLVITTPILYKIMKEKIHNYINKKCEKQ